MAESSSSPDWDRLSRSRSQSQGRWMKKDRAEPPDSWEDDDDGRWQWWHKDDWYQNQDWDHKEDQGPSQGWKDWDEEDDGGSWQRYDERWKENPEKGRSLKKGQQEPWKRAGRMSGAAVAKQKLQKIQERDGIPADPEEKKKQRLGAMSQSRYNRLMKRQQEQEDKEAFRQQTRQEVWQQAAAWMSQCQQQGQMHQPYWVMAPVAPASGSRPGGLLLFVLLVKIHCLFV